MARLSSPSQLFTVWDLSTDTFDHTQLAANWDKADAQLSASGKSIRTITSFPSSPSPGDVAITSTAVGGFAAWTMIEYDGTQWKAIGPVEVLGAVPVSNLYQGRLVILSSSTTNFSAWSLIRYNGSTWDYVSGPFGYVNTGPGATNINGAQINGDIYVNSGSRGIVFTDRTSGTKYRLYINSGALYIEAVT